MSNTRRRYLVCYDIAHPKRLRAVAKTLQGYGTRIQYSVFECALDDLKRQQVDADLARIINTEHDQVLFVGLGPQANDATFVIEALGLPYTVRTRVTIV